MADKGYDTDAIVAHVTKKGSVGVIAPKKSRTTPRLYDEELYKERHKRECLFGFFKHYRRLFSRRDKIASRFQAFLPFTTALQWMK